MSKPEAVTDQYVFIAEGEGADCQIVNDLSLRSLHKFMCSCDNLETCEVESVRDAVESLQDDNNWTLDEDGKKFCCRVADYETGHMDVYVLHVTASRDAELRQWKEAAKGCDSPSALETLLRAFAEGGKTWKELCDKKDAELRELWERAERAETTNRELNRRNQSLQHSLNQETGRKAWRGYFTAASQLFGEEYDKRIKVERQRDELSKALDFVVSINAESDSCGRVVVKIYTEEWQNLRALARLGKETK